MKKIKVTKEELIRAFEAWETFNRLRPDDCMTTEDLHELNVRDAAIIHTETLIGYINDYKAVIDE